MKRVFRRTLAAMAAGTILSGVIVAGSGPAMAQGKTLKFVQNGNLTILDPIWTTAYVTRNHGYFIYDTLFAVDENNAVKPQMVEKYEVSPDKTVWTFTLRDGLEWHDGKPVTAEDCIASIKRWGARDAMGQKLMDFVKEFKQVDGKTFQMVLKEPYGLVLDSLGKPSSQVPFMMPKKVADTDPFKQIDSQIGSGPFIYQNAESKPGEKHVYIKNPKYKPRSEPASGLSGGKVVKVDRVEIIEMPDTQQQVNAIIAGEIDLIEQPPHDLIPVLKKDKGVKLVDWNPLGHQFIIRFNHLVKPFDNPKIRQAALLAMRQEDYLKATVGEPEFYKVCSAAFVCGTPNAFDAPNGLLVKPDFEKAKALLKEAGYDGTPVVLMQSTTLPVLTNTAPVTKALLEQAGFKVDMQSMDWQTLVTRRTKKEPPSQGGWNVFHTFSVAADILNPISTSYMVAQGDKSWFGWPTDPVIEKLRDDYAKETDPEKNKALAKAVQDRALETAQYGWIGQWYGPGVARANVTGWLKAPVPVMWNIEKK
ncbi:MAG: ABC transporter substrate-binding protein [Reyranella sp.]|jgi:peptide/nickel transport system substrate-binding protein|uniref:ABC transporter substrate-binding protein n=1 Tax=Reyranella sp. TaxID=1929291 RepID=UPI0025D80D8A|nr:ABC transporter substrate-binding protein [Reyranella sp.]MBR2813608.1 ABC transporter substrate-binding protein [Reyranella sp.]